MKWILNLRIGTKLASASMLAALLVGAMIASQMTGNATVRRSYRSGLEQQTIARDAVDAKASIRGMQTGVRDLRLANAPADMQKASEYLAARLKSVQKFTDEMISLSHSAENRARIEKLKSRADAYAKGAQQIAAVRNEAIALRTAGAPDAADKIVKLNDEAVRIAREVTLPIAAEMAQLSNQVADFAKHR